MTGPLSNLGLGLFDFCVFSTGRRLSGMGAYGPEFCLDGPGAAWSSSSLSVVVIPLMNDRRRCTIKGSELSAGVIPICFSISRRLRAADDKPASGRNVDRENSILKKSKNSLMRSRHSCPSPRSLSFQHMGFSNLKPTLYLVAVLCCSISVSTLDLISAQILLR